MKSVRYMARNHVAANLLMAFLLAGGLLTTSKLKVEVFPEIELDRVSISVAYPGAGPEEVEDGIVRPIEEAVYGLDGVKRIVANAAEGGGTVLVELLEGTDADVALQDVKSAVDRIITFPQDAERPVIKKLVNRRSVLSVVLYGDTDLRALRQEAEQIRDELLTSEAISQAEISGVPPYEISIEIPERSLRRYGLTLPRVAEVVRAASIDLPAGEVRATGGEILIRTKERRYTAREYEDVVVAAEANGALVRLADIASVHETFAETDEAGIFDGKPAVMINVFRIGDQSPTGISRTVRAYLADKRSDISPALRLAVWDDRSDILQQRMSLLGRNALLGLVLVVVVLGLLMRLRLALWVTLGIPISLLGAMIVMPFVGVSINMISLFAFILVLGIVVDDAIVVGENIYARHQAGEPYAVASPEGAIEVGRPVIFSVMTTIAAFVPLLFVGGTMGKFMFSIPAIVIGVLAMSLIESLYVLPAHLNRKQSDGRQQADAGKSRSVLDRWYRLSDRLLQWVIHVPYRRTLHLALKHRYTTLALSLVTLALAIGLFLGGHLKVIFLPEVEGDVVRGQLTMPVGTLAEETRRHAQHMIQAARAVVQEYDAKLDADERSDGTRKQRTILKHIYAQVGKRIAGGGARAAGSDDAGGHIVDVAVLLKEVDERNVEARAFADAWRERLGEIAGAESVEFTSQIVSMGKPIAIQLAHRRFEVLEAATAQLKEALGEYAGVYDITDSHDQGKRELKLRLKPGARALGLTERDLGQQVRAAFHGDEALRLQRDRNEVKVMVRYPPEERRSLADVEKMAIRTPQGGEIPFDQAAYVDEGRGYSTVTRVDRKRVIDVSARTDTQQANPNEVLAQLRQGVLPQLLAQYGGLSYDLEGEQREQRESFGSLGTGLIAALGMIFVLLAIPMRSYAQPLIIMSAIPFGLIGAVLGHLLLGYNLSMMSFFGVVALAGVVVNDSLVLVDFVNRFREQGIPIYDAVMDAGFRRFRPIIMTTLTTFFALVPMLSETSVQARFLVPMAISLGFGVVGATLITLVLVPTLYLILADLKRLAAKIRESARQLFQRPPSPSA